VSERASTFLNNEGVEVFIDEDEDGYSVPEPTVESDGDDDGDTEPVENKDDDLLDLPSLEEELPEEEPDLELPDEEVVLDEKFAKYFEKATGMPIKDFGETLYEIKSLVKEVGAEGLKNGIAFIKASQQATQIEAVRSQVDKLWGVSRDESLKRLEQIKPYFDRMSKEKQKLYDTPEGADLIWRSIEAKSPSTKTQTSKSGKNPAGRRYVFTQAQIDAMSKDEYAKNAEKITEAYQKNLVEY
jgi:hypothetical protein